MTRPARPRVLTVVGARPQFVKAAPLSRALRERVDEILVHTGQHYDHDMSQGFFDELGIPAPDRHLGIGSGGHGRMTGRMLEALEDVLAEVRPDMVIVLGDTNSTLAGALAAAKLGLPVAHVEAGLRSFDRRMPEEINRVLTDHVSNLLFCPTEAAVLNLKREGITKGVHRVGDVMMDAVFQNLARAQASGTRPTDRPRHSYFLATIHRAENTDDPARLQAILETLGKLGAPTLLPLHPRTRKRMEEIGLGTARNVELLPPAPYSSLLLLLDGARAVLTDSGGIQKEAFILGTPCVTLRESTEWVETVEAGANRLAGADPGRILRAVRAAERAPRPRAGRRAYGGGLASRRIAVLVERAVRSGKPRKR